MSTIERQPPREKPHEATIERCMVLLRRFVDGKFSKEVERTFEGEEFNRISVRVNPLKRLYPFSQTLGKISFISERGINDVAVTYTIVRNKNGLNVIYSDEGQLISDNSRPKIEKLSRSEKLKYRKKYGKRPKRLTKPFEKDLKNVSEEEFSRRVDELDDVMLRNNIF